MATVSTDNVEQFEDALREFEEAVLSPVVPGELVRWTETTAKSTAALRSTLATRISSDHASVLNSIAEADPELIPRVELIRVEDEALGARANEMAEAAEQLHSMAEVMEPEEEDFKVLMKHFLTAAEKFASRVKIQEQAITTWYVESQQRDRGLVD